MPTATHMSIDLKTVYFSVVLQVLFTETLHTAGLVTLMFTVLPQLDVTRGTFLMTGIALVPALLGPFIQSDTPSSRHYIKKFIDVIAIFIQLSAVLFYPLFNYLTDTDVMNPSLNCDNPSVVTSSPMPNTSVFSGTSSSPAANTIIDLSSTTLNTLNISIPDISILISDYSPSIGSVGEFLTAAGVAKLQELSPSITSSNQDQESVLPLLWFTPLALLLISLSHWENFVDQNNGLGCFGDMLMTMRKEIQQARTKIMAVSSLYKMFLTFLLAIPVYVYLYGDSASIEDLFNSNNFYDTSACAVGMADDW